MASVRHCRQCQELVLVSISDRIATVRCEIAILDRAQAAAVIMAGGRRLHHLREGTFRAGPSLTWPMLVEHRCRPRNADQSRSFYPPDAVPPF